MDPADAALADEIERTWSALRQAFLDFRLDDVKKLLPVPPGAPLPTREQSRQFGEFLPDLRRGRRVKLLREGDRAGLVVRFDKAPGVEIAIVRFGKTAGGWTPLPGTETVSSYATDEELDEAAIAALIATRGSLQLFPKED
jgi:hypothetical protein